MFSFSKQPSSRRSTIDSPSGPRQPARRLAISFLFGCSIASIASAAQAERFSLDRASSPEATLTVRAGELEGLSVVQEIHFGGHVADVVEIGLEAPGARAGGQVLRWRPERARGLADGPATVRFVMSGADPASGESVVEIFDVEAALIGGQASLTGLPEEVEPQASGWVAADTVLELVDDAMPARKILALPPPPDPTTRTSYGCYYVQTYHWNYGGDVLPKVIGKIRWPSATCSFVDGPPANRPFLMFSHGNLMEHTDHDYLMAHLAKNGFVTASISNGAWDGGSNEGRAREAISYLNGMYAYWGWKHRLSNKVAFAGHSRGGEAAVTAARLLSEDPSLGHEDYDVRAVISLAPTDGEGSNHVWAKESLVGAMTPAFLGIYGSKDPDVAGFPTAPWPAGPETTVFAIYDRAGSEFSTEGVVLAGIHLTKAMVFIDRANHRGFLDTDACNPAGIGCLKHQNAAKAYFNAFLRWHVYSQTENRGFFDGQWRPSSLLEVDLAQQYSGGLRRVIDNFEQGPWSSSTIGGSVLKGTGIVAAAEDDLIDMDPATPHDTRGMRIKWGDPGTQNVRWYIPNESPFAIGPLRDFSVYDFLSLRAGQTYNDAWNVPDQAQDFHVRLYSGQGWSSKVPVSAYGDLAYPDEVVLQPFGANEVGDYSKTTMETIRVPLSAFANVDLTNVIWVTLYFDVPGHGAGSIQIDSLELTN